MRRDQLAEHMEEVFDRVRVSRAEGQKECSHDNGNAFANFIRVGERPRL